MEEGPHALVVGMRVGAGWTENAAKAVVMGDRGGDEDVEAEGVKVRVASLRMGMQVGVGGGDGDGLGQTAGWRSSLDPSPADATRAVAREPCAAVAAAPAAASQAAVAVTLRAARDSGCGRVGAWGPGRGKEQEQTGSEGSEEARADGSRGGAAATAAPAAQPPHWRARRGRWLQARGRASSRSPRPAALGTAPSPRNPRAACPRPLRPAAPSLPAARPLPERDPQLQPGRRNRPLQHSQRRPGARGSGASAHARRLRAVWLEPGVRFFPGDGE